MAKSLILIVEDEAIVTMHIQSTLEDLGYEVPTTAMSGDEAIQLAKDLHPDLILMDLALEGQMDGIEAASKIKAHSDIPVIYLTAHTDSKIMQRAKATAPLGYVYKPFDKDDLQRILEAAIQDKV